MRFHENCSRPQQYGNPTTDRITGNPNTHRKRVSTSTYGNTFLRADPKVFAVSERCASVMWISTRRPRPGCLGAALTETTNTPEFISMSFTRAKNVQVSSSLDLYMREFRDRAPLTAVEEKDLAVAIACGDEDALSRMIQANLRLVVGIARFFLGRGLAFDDLVGEGNLGLIRAAKDFKPEFGTRFSTYAAYWIKESIRHALMNSTSTIRLPAYMIRLLTKLRRAETALVREGGKTPSFDEVASVLGLSDTQKMLTARARQTLRVESESGLAFEQGIRSVSDMWNVREEPEASIEFSDKQRDLLQRMQRLEARERTILELRYGLAGDMPLTLREVGRRLGIHQEWVRRIQCRAIRKLVIDAVEPVGSFRGTGSAVTSPAPPQPDRVYSRHEKPRRLTDAGRRPGHPQV
jgi:RNA polymerase primary sigma factor